MSTVKTIGSEAETVSLIGAKIKSLFAAGCKRILFINPPQVAEQDFDQDIARLGFYYAFPPYGPGVLVRTLENHGYTADIVDLNYEVLLSAQSPHFHYRIWQKFLDKKVIEFKPDLVCISVMFSMTHDCMLETAKYVRETYPAVVVMAGGVHPTGCPEVILEITHSIDFVMRYESDNSLVSFCDYVNGASGSEDLSQLATLHEGRYIEIVKRDRPNEDRLSIAPDYKALPIGEYSGYGRIGSYSWLFDSATHRSSSIISNRGCRARCTFCSVENFNFRGVRGRSIQSVIDELQTLRDVYGINHVMWLDDDLFYDTERTISLFQEMTRHELGITWDATNGIIASAATAEIIHAAAQSGCRGLNIGIESGNPEILKSVLKPSAVKHFRRLAEMLKGYPQIFSKGLLMIGFPGETMGQIWDTINLAREILLDWYPIQIVAFFANTSMTNSLLQQGMLSEDKIVDARFFNGTAGGQKQREREEKQISKFIPDILQRDGAYVPTPEELKDIWFLADWLVNYERILPEYDPVKLEMKKAILTNICERMSVNNPLSTMFLGIVENRLNQKNQALERFKRAKVLVGESEFWRIRFDALKLNDLLEEQAALAAQ